MTSWTPEIAQQRGPRYLRIADSLASAVTNGNLKPGDRLPTHRDLAWKLGVTVGTITRAYAEAERRGLISGEVGRGTSRRRHRRSP
jgi:DNA-binding transcriptional MocR family regulator